MGRTKYTADLLRGNLYLYIIEAKDLPNLDASLFSRKKDVSDPHVTVETYLGGKQSDRLAKTKTIDDDLNPRWLEKFEIELCHELDSIKFMIKDSDLVKSEKIGSVTVSAEDLKKGEEIEGWFTIDGSRKNNGSIRLSIHFISKEDQITSYEVPNCVYPMRIGCSMKMYHNAHAPAVPPYTDVKDRHGEAYKPNQLWIEITEAIEKAEKLIYICGWAVKHDLTLLRSGNNDETLGEQLKRKAASGVISVLVMVWDEALSNEVYPPGMMGTHDEQTFNYFRTTNVQCVKAPRSKEHANALEKKFVNTTFTHHQKCVIVDAAGDDSNRRKLVAFQGGIDLTDGRWDTFEHPLYKTLFTEHKDDFYNGICPTTQQIGPREPWNDQHMYVEGKAAYDILDNFVARWSKLDPDKRNFLYNITDADFDMDWHNDNEDNWNMQYFRSIDSNSVLFNIDQLQHVKTKKGRHYDDSIQKAYIHHIRKAKRFIYIENQYFLGSSYSWKIPHFKCTHLIPMELTLRIIEAIKKNEEFRVYIVIPIHPEGDPKSAPVQEILRWQFYTMQMMYKKIGAAIQDAKLVNAHPTDYLSFFCLTKRDSANNLPQSGLIQPVPHTPPDECRRSFRFMIYVHSKMAIFDDEYIIIGSANINERSMSGRRDSEMAFGGYQPNLLDNGDVRTHRLAVWAAHCGKHMEEHLNPSSMQCMEAMKWLGQENLTEYLKPHPFPSDSHLMTYPLYVEKDGDLDELHSCEEFPVTGGRIMGKASMFLPNRLTT